MTVEWQISAKPSRTPFPAVATVGKAGRFFPGAFQLGVGDEDHSVGPGEHGLACCLVLDLSRNRVQLDQKLVTSDPAEFQGHEIEEESAVGRCIEAVEPRSFFWIAGAVDGLETGRFSADGRAVVDDLEFGLPLPVVKLNHRNLPDRASSRE